MNLEFSSDGGHDQDNKTHRETLCYKEDKGITANNLIVRANVLQSEKK